MPAETTVQKAAPSPEAEDALLLRGFLAHDPELTSRLYDRVAPLVYGLGLRVLGDSRLAEDLVADAFVAASRRGSEKVPPPESLEQWFVAVALRLVASRRPTPSGDCRSERGMRR